MHLIFSDLPGSSTCSWEIRSAHSLEIACTPFALVSRLAGWNAALLLLVVILPLAIERECHRLSLVIFPLPPPSNFLRKAFPGYGHRRTWTAKTSISELPGILFLIQEQLILEVDRAVQIKFSLGTVWFAEIKVLILWSLEALFILGLVEELRTIEIRCFKRVGELIMLWFLWVCKKKKKKKSTP